MTGKAGGKFHPGRCGVRPARETEALTRRAGESLIRVGAVGIRIWKTPPRFPNSWAGGQTFPRPQPRHARHRREEARGSYD